MKIAIFGLGYVGMTSAVCLAELGHQILGVEISKKKVDIVNRGESPIFEPGISERLARHVASGLLTSTADGIEALESADLALICVGTPSKGQGAIDDTHLLNVISDIAAVRLRLDQAIPIFVRSTALPEVHRRAMDKIAAIAPNQPLLYCVHPEFLRAGQAISDFFDPPKVVYGISDQAIREVAARLYPGITAATTFTDPTTAALVKYADNIFHAVKVTYTNEISMLAKANDVDAREVLKLVSQDTKLNISSYYMRPGFAFGGSCLPKDLRAALTWSRQNMVSLPMLEHVLASNQTQVDRLINRIIAFGARHIAMFGLAFKADTDDLRESPLVTMAETLHGKGCSVRIYDPALRVERMVGGNRTFALQVLPHLADMMVDTPEDLLASAEVIVVGRNFSEVNWSKLPWRSQQVLLDLDGRIDFSSVGPQVHGLYWP